jgi:hypothetical protein
VRTIACLPAFPVIVLGACDEPSPPSDASVPSFQPGSTFTLVSTIAFVSTREPTFSPDGEKLLFHGANLLANWGELRVRAE